MKKGKILALALAVLTALIVFAGCSQSTGGSPAAGGSAPPAGSSAAAPAPSAPGSSAVGGSATVSDLSGDIMIAAAASLQNAFEQDLIPMFAKQYPNIKVSGTYDSSGKLQTQIENGLDAQIFFSAATKQMDTLVSENLIDGTSVVNLLGNKLVLITGVNTQTTVTGFDNITDAKTIEIGDPSSVPAGQYAQSVLTSLGSWDTVSARASLGTNVTEVLNAVAQGSAEVGVVYLSDAQSMPDQVKVIAEAPAGSVTPPIVYPLGLSAKLGANADAAKAFFDFLQTQAAKDVFTKYGFTTN